MNVNEMKIPPSGKRSTHGLRKHQYVLVHCEGEGGDVVVGHITSVRGDNTLGVNLLTNEDFKKQTKDLVNRNTVCSKKVAMRVVKEYHLEATPAEGRARARKLAVQLANAIRGKAVPATPHSTQQPLSLVPTAMGVLRDYVRLSADEKRVVLKTLFKDYAPIFGIT